MAVFNLENVSKSFFVDKKENVVLRNINLSLPDKGLVSIEGKSGSGKSTLLNILMGIEKPTSGKIFYKKKDISKFNDKKFSNYHLNSVSLIFQHYNLFDDLTSIENAIIPLKMKSIKSSKAIEEASELFKRFGIEDLINRKTKNLSGGEKQRVAIIRSLLTKPKAILCDEPTGALDYKNSREIMGILKEISKNTLVVMVSHNKELVTEYSDEILYLKDGQLEKTKKLNKVTDSGEDDIRKKTYSSGWTNKFLKINFKRDLKKNIFSIISCSISFAAMFLSVGFSEGSKSSQEEALLKNLSVGYATISEIENIDIEGSPLLFQKTTKPSITLIDENFVDFTSIRYEENISYFISNYPTCRFHDETFNNFQMVPVYDLSLSNYGSDLLIEGVSGGNNFEEILVNEEFVKLLGTNPINETITLNNSATINYSTGDEENPFIKDTLNYSKKFKIVGILKEFSFLNSPKIYYSYKGAKDFLKGTLMENLSFYLGKKYSFYNYLENCSNDDPATSYSSYIFLNDLSEANKFFGKIIELKDSKLSITSTVFDIHETYSTFINSFSTTLILFVLIAFAGINFILGMISLSTFIENKKSTAIMTCLGARNHSIYNLYLTENYLVILISFVLSCFLAGLIQKLLNPFLLEKFSLSNLIVIPFSNYFGLPFGLIIVLFLIAMLFSTIFTLTPMYFYRHKSLSDELRDEWWLN